MDDRLQQLKDFCRSQRVNGEWRDNAKTHVAEWAADEIDRLRAQLAEAQKIVELVTAERDEAQRQLADMRKGEPVAWLPFDVYGNAGDPISNQDHDEFVQPFGDHWGGDKPLFLAAPKVPEVLVDRLSRLSSKLYEGRLHPQYASEQIDEIVAMLNAAPEPKGGE